MQGHVRFHRDRKAAKRALGLLAAAALALSPLPVLAQGAVSGMFMRYAVSKGQVPRALLAAAKAKFGCDDAVMGSGVTGFQMSEESAIWQIPCERFAYQASAVYALVYLPDPAAQHEFLTIPALKGRTRDQKDVLFNPVWDVKARTVTSFTKGRGLGDCGTYEKFRVTAEGHFRLLEYRAKDACDGNATPPEQFPLIFKASR